MIEAEGLVKRYGSTVALAGLDLAVEAGAVMAVLGPNGAGKTTAVRILATLLVPDAGRAPSRATMWSQSLARCASALLSPASTRRWMTA